MLELYFQIGLLLIVPLSVATWYMVCRVLPRQEERHREMMATLEAFATMVGDLLEKRSRER